MGGGGAFTFSIIVHLNLSATTVNYLLVFNEIKYNLVTIQDDDDDDGDGDGSDDNDVDVDDDDEDGGDDDDDVDDDDGDDDDDGNRIQNNFF